MLENPYINIYKHNLKISARYIQSKAIKCVGEKENLVCKYVFYNQYINIYV